jgi:hypothetical protein
MMEAASSSEMSVITSATRLNIPKTPFPCYPDDGGATFFRNVGYY